MASDATETASQDSADARQPIHTGNSAGTTAVGELEEFRYQDRLVRCFATAALVWGLLATLLGLYLTLNLVLPELLWPLGVNAQYLSFSRLRPLHVHALIFAFAGNAMFAAVYYSTPRLCKTQMWSDLLGWLHFWGWQGIIIAAAATLPLGISQAREYAELEWPIDVAIGIVWILCFGVNFFMTLATRRQRRMYVSLWFYIATVVTFAIVHVVGNLAIAINPWNSYSLYGGVNDAFVQWWHGHTLLAYLLTMPFLGLMYYFVPKAAERPIYSYKLAIVHFWAMVPLLILAAPRHLHYTPLPEWASSLGMLFGLMLWMPAWGGVINGLLTLRGATADRRRDPALKFFTFGLVVFGIVAFEESLLSIKTISRWSQYTDWTVAHFDLGLLGWNGMLAFGMIYWLLPRLFQTKLWSPKLANGHFWIAAIGVLMAVVPMYVAGITEAFMRQALDETGRLIYPNFIEIVQTVKPIWWAALIGIVLYAAGILLMVFNHTMTWLNRPAAYAVQRDVSAPRSAAPVPAEPVLQSSLQDVPVLELGKRLDVWRRLHWHQRWERLPGKLTLLVLLLVAVACLLEMVPLLLLDANRPAIASIQPYTPLELAGRDLYIREGCYSCHTQTVRPLLSDTKRYGEYSKAGEFVYDHPALWGDRRVGPDLAREGGNRTSDWHWRHLQDPQATTPGSVMPSFEHLLSTPLDFQRISDRVWIAQTLGAEYEFDLDEAPVIAREQAEAVAAQIVSQGVSPRVLRANQEPLYVFDTEAVALVAYLQRLGMDAFRSAATAAPAATDVPAAPAAPAATDPPAAAESPAPLAQ